MQRQHMFRITKKRTFYKAIGFSQYITDKEVSLLLNDLCKNTSILASIFYVQSFVKFSFFIGTTFSEGKICMKTLFCKIYKTVVIIEIVQWFFKWVVTFIMYMI